MWTAVFEDISGDDDSPVVGAEGGSGAAAEAGPQAARGERGIQWA